MKNKELEMNPEDLKLLINQNIILKICLLVMNDINIDKADDESIDFMDLWNKVSLQKKIDAGKVTPESKSLYYDIFSTGYENFGAMFFNHMSKEENIPYLCHGIISITEALADYSEIIDKLVKENKELKEKLKA